MTFLKRIAIPGVAATGLLAGCITRPIAGSALLADYDGNTLLCRNEITKAVCHLWLYADGRYFVFYDRGIQQVMPVAGGNFRIEARRGRFLIKSVGDVARVCMVPEKVAGKTFQIEQNHELFAGTGCYELRPHKPGDTWLQSEQGGRDYKMWLVRGRG